MSENSLTAQGIHAQLNKNFPNVQTTAVSHVEANGGDHFFMVLVRAQPAEEGEKQQQSGPSHGSKHVTKPPKKHGAAAAVDETDDGTEKLNSALNRHLIRLLQGRPHWEVFSEKGKQQPTGSSSGHKHVTGAASMDAPAEEVIPSVNGGENGFAGQNASDDQEQQDAVDPIFQTLADMEP